MTIDSYFASLPDGFASIEQMRDLLRCRRSLLWAWRVRQAKRLWQPFWRRLCTRRASAPAYTMQAVNRWLSVSVSMEHRWTKACSA